MAPLIGLGKKKEKLEGHLPLMDLVIFTVVANVSIISLNTSLMVNSVAFYQIAKLGIIPFTATVEATFFGKEFSGLMKLAIAVTLVGVGLVTVAEFNVSSTFFGCLVALCSIISSAMQQILCGWYQKKNSISAGTLLGKTAPVQGLSMLLLSPLLDKLLTGSTVFNYEISMPALVFVALSCSCAVLVNMSQFLCLGRFTAVTYQVVGHAKTVLVLLVGWAFFGGHISLQQVGGILLAIGGMSFYGYASNKFKAVKDAEKMREKHKSREDLESAELDAQKPLVNGSTPHK